MTDPQGQAATVPDDDYDYDDYAEPAPCWRCDEGVVVTCPDDLCRGQGSCMHGDGEIVCPECHGEEWL
jgi:hypothetical protein